MKTIFQYSFEGKIPNGRLWRTLVLKIIVEVSLNIYHIYTTTRAGITDLNARHLSEP